MMDGCYYDYTDIIKRAVKSVNDILNSTGEQMLNPTPTVREECTVIHKYTWKDIVKIGDKVFCEEFPISGDTDGDDEYYRIDDFMAAVAEKHGVDVDDIQTYMMDSDIEFEVEGLEFGAEDCGCYIDGIAEWVIDKWCDLED